MEQLSILIVDDDKTTTSILNHMLNPYADIIITAPDGIEGLARFQEYTPDIILSDINMPRMNGLEMVEEIRKTDENVKIAIFTDFEKRDILLKAIELGVNQFLSKPFASKSFSKTMQQLYNEVIEKDAVTGKFKDSKISCMPSMKCLITSYNNLTGPKHFNKK